jgi:homoserine O-acetyltransferase
MTTSLVVADASEAIDLATAEMKWSHIRHLPVVDGRGCFIGLVHATDVAAAIARHKPGVKLPVGAVMRQDVFTVTPDTPLATAIELMLDLQLNALPVVDDHKRLVGILTEADFVRRAYTQLTGAEYVMRV